MRILVSCLIAWLYVINVAPVVALEQLDAKLEDKGNVANVDVCQNAPTIFVSVASYRDSECPTTVSEIFNKAQCPGRVFVGICQQNDASQDADCLKEYAKRNEQPRTNQIRIMRLKHTEAKGPTWARYLVSTLWQDEDYYFQIDSHTRFLAGWDSKLIDMIKKAPTEKAIISHYPLNYDAQTNSVADDYKNVVPEFSTPGFNNDGILQAGSQIMPRSTELKPTYYAAAGMMFGSSKFLLEVPFDPYLPFLFHGEEILFSARLYAAGWRFYTPTENVVFHYYIRAEAPHVWSAVPQWYNIQQLALQRVRYILGVEQNVEALPPSVLYQVENYGIANKAALKEYLDNLGVDWINKKVMKTFP